MFCIICLKPSGDLLTGDSNGAIVGWNGNQTNFCISNVHQGNFVLNFQVFPKKNRAFSKEIIKFSELNFLKLILFLLLYMFLGGIFSIQIDPEGDIITGGGKDGRIVATSPEGEVLDETSLPGYFQKCVF